MNHQFYLKDLETAMGKVFTLKTITFQKKACMISLIEKDAFYYP